MASDIRYRIEKVSRHHERSSFDCGVDSLNTFLSHFARQNTEKGISTTYVLIKENDHRVLAFYSISSAQIARNVLPPAVGLPRYPIPSVRIGRLATDKSAQNQGLGRLMLVHAISRAVRLSQEIAIYAIEVDAINEEARQFYLHYGFEPLIDDPLHLYLPIKEAKRYVGIIKDAS